MDRALCLNFMDIWSVFCLMLKTFIGFNSDHNGSVWLSGSDGFVVIWEWNINQNLNQAEKRFSSVNIEVEPYLPHQTMLILGLCPNANDRVPMWQGNMVNKWCQSEMCVFISSRGLHQERLAYHISGWNTERERGQPELTSISAFLPWEITQSCSVTWVWCVFSTYRDCNLIVKYCQA